MVERPEGPESPLQKGLRELAQGRGPSIGKLQYAIAHPEENSTALQRLTALTASMPDSTERQRAEALWTIIKEEIDKINDTEQHPMCRAALRAAFRLDMEAYRGEEYDGLSRRLDRARAIGHFGRDAGHEAPRRHWVMGVWRLAHQVETRLVKMAPHPETWQVYRTAGGERPESIMPVPADAQPLLVDRLVATYAMTGRTVHYAITERLVTAREDGVDEYIVRAYSPISGHDSVQVRALLNCRAGSLRSLPDGRGGYIHEIPMQFPKPLLEGEQCFFASQVSSQQNEQPIVEIQVTSHGISTGGLTMRVQFDEHPVAAWWFGECIDARRLDKPPDGHPRRLTWSVFGYLEHTFNEFCKPMAKYGIGWEWA